MIKEKLKNLINNVKLRQTRVITIAIGLVFTVMATGASAFYLVNKNDSANVVNNESAGDNISESDSIVAIVGAEDSSIIGNTKSNNSWSGEIISLNNLQVQPDREGTISQWYVNIGELVRAGQVIGELSRPPQTPEMISMLAEKSQMLSESLTTVEALRTYKEKRISQLKQLRIDTEQSNKQKIDLLGSQQLGSNTSSNDNGEDLLTYTEKRISQLKQLRIDTEQSNKQKIDLLGSNTLVNENLLLSSIALKKKLAQVILRGSISRTLPMISNQTIIPKPELIYNIQLKWLFGINDLNVRNSFESVLSSALFDLKDLDKVPEKSGILYFDTVIKLANSSITDNETLSETSLESIKKMLIQDQSEFITVLGEIKSMELERVNTQRESINTLDEINAMIIELEKELAMLELERVNTQRESINTLDEINAMIIELEKELAMAEGDVKAKEAAYVSVRDSISGGYSIVAPNNGVVSSIMKKPGEFVGPGMPVATVTTGGNDGVLVRMRLPSNIQKPAMGESFSIIRPGFGTDVQKVRLVGIGSSLDDGSYIADAVFTEATKWPIGASVRILPSTSSPSVIIKYSSFFWDKEGIPTVWSISEADRIFAKKITIGRTLGDFIEVYTGLKNGDRYIANPSPEIKEDMFLSDLVGIPTPKKNNTSVPTKSGGHPHGEDDGH